MEALLKRIPISGTISGPISNHERKFRGQTWLPPVFLPNENPAGVSKRRIALQKDHMLEKYPNFQIIFQTDWGIAWKGILRPAFRSYEILILFIPGADYSDISISEMSLSVFVTSPALERRPETPEKPIPHLYRSIQYPLLCIYHPQLDRWSSYTSFISDEIMMWVSQWLLTYEFWHLTGEWLAPEAHPEQKQEMPVVENLEIIPTRKFQRFKDALPLMHFMSYILPEIEENQPTFNPQAHKAENQRVA